MPDQPDASTTAARERKKTLLLIEEYIQSDEDGKMESPRLAKLDNTQRGSSQSNEKDNLLGAHSLKDSAQKSSSGANDSKDFAQVLNRFSSQLYNNRWSSQVASNLVHLSHVLGHSNLIYFPSLCARHGGAAFLIPYIVSYMCVGIPLLYAEMILGQFSSLPPIEIFCRMSPPLAGISLAMLAVVVYRSLYFSAIIAQLFYAGVLTIQGLWTEDLPGSSCDDPEYHSQFCHPHMIEKTCNTSLMPTSNVPTCMNYLRNVQNPNRVWIPPHTDYMISAVFKPRFLASELELPSAAVSVILLAVWVVSACCAFKGARAVSRAFVILKAISVVVVVINMVISIISQSNEEGGLSYFLKPDYTHLANMEAWSSAISHVLFSLNLGDGTVHRLASYNDFNENFIYNAMIISASDILFSLMAGITFFSAAGTVSASLYPRPSSSAPMRIHRTLYTGFTFTLTALPEQLQLTASPLWSTLVSSAHYFNLAKSGLTNLVMYLELIIISTSNAFSRFVDWDGLYPAVKKSALTAAIALLGFGMSVVYAGPSGIYLTKLVDEFTGVSLLVICLAEVMAVIYAYGFRRFLANVETMIIGEDRDWKISITSLGIFYYVVTPFFLVMGLILKAVYNHKSVINDFIFPDYFEVFGWLIVLSCVGMIPLTLAYHLVRTGIRPSVMSAIFEPTYLWGPVREEDREKNIKNERVVRK